MAQLATRPSHRRPPGPPGKPPGDKEPRRHALAQLLQPDGSIDWSPWYLTEEEDMGQSGEQGQIIALLYSSLKSWARERQWPATTLVACDQFFAWVPGEPYVQVSPDVFLLDDPVFTAEDRFPGRWNVGRADQRPPRFVVEIVSTDWKKDYEINPARYDHLGVDELVLVDADAVVRDLSDRGRYPLTVYRRSNDDRLEQVYRGPGPGYCAEIDAYLCIQFIDDGPAVGSPRVRVCRDAEGRDIVLTGDEMSAVAAAELAALAADNASLAADNASLAADNADKDARLAALEAELAAVRAKVPAKAHDSGR